MIMEACDALWQSEEGRFELHVFINSGDDKPYMVQHQPYTDKTISAQWSVLMFFWLPAYGTRPSGSQVPEAMGYGKPSIVTEHVGAKDLIVSGKSGQIIDASVEALTKAMREFIRNPRLISEYSDYILHNAKIKTMEEHAKEIIELYEMRDR